MSTDKRVGWLRDLTVGSMVWVRSGSFRSTYVQHTVDAITPSGRIRIGTTEYDPDGWQRGGTRSVSRRILVADDDAGLMESWHTEHMRDARRRLVDAAESCVDTDLLERALAVLRGAP